MPKKNPKSIAYLEKISNMKFIGASLNGETVIIDKEGVYFYCQIGNDIYKYKSYIELVNFLKEKTLLDEALERFITSN